MECWNCGIDNKTVKIYSKGIWNYGVRVVKQLPLCSKCKDM